MSLFAKSDPTPISAWPTERSAAEILELLSGYRDYPQTERGRKLFIRAIMQARSPEHAEAALGIIEGKFPTLGQMRDAIRRTAGEFKQQINPNPQCERCAGLGWQVIAGNYEGVKRCDCWGDYELPQLDQSQRVDPDWWKKELREALKARKKRDEEQLAMLLQLSRKTPPEPQG